MTNRELITTLLSYPMDLDIYLVCEDPIKKKDIVFPIKDVEELTTQTRIRFNDWRSGAVKKEEQSGSKEEPSNSDVEKELKKLIDIVMIGSLLKSLNPDDKED